MEPSNFQCSAILLTYKEQLVHTNFASQSQRTAGSEFFSFFLGKKKNQNERNCMSFGFMKEPMVFIGSCFLIFCKLWRTVVVLCTSIERILF
jgi:hypothetical protein